MQQIWRRLCSSLHVKVRHRMIFWSISITKMCSLLQFVHQKSCFSRRIIECKGNFRKVWTVVNGALSRKRSKQSSLCLYERAYRSIVGKKSLKSALNSYYTTIPSVVIPPQSRVSCFTLVEKSFFFSPCGATEIYSGIFQLPISRSVDSFGLSNHILKKKPVCF